MAVRTEAVRFHSCDLCEQDFNEDELTRPYGPQQSGMRVQIDICVDCQQRPAADVIDWIRSRQQATSPRPV
jgi:hypothetical protein